MLLSMTGFGESVFQSDDLLVAVEIRTVNNRYLKLNLRVPEAVSHLEPEIERTLRQSIRRGTVQLQLQVQRAQSAQDYALNLAALRAYLQQLIPIQSELNLSQSGFLGGLLALPGVVQEPELGRHDIDADWPVIARVLKEALAKLEAMRREEGRAMGEELVQLRKRIADQLDRIRGRAPAVIDQFRDRLTERLRQFLQEHDVQIDRSELIKEVAVFAERSDITEEIVRLASHLDQFLDILKEPDSPGRKLDFLIQEMFRETNTIGSKASDVEIAREVVEIKSSIEKIRELIQNIE